jgi:hypothetical protein
MYVKCSLYLGHGKTCLKHLINAPFFGFHKLFSMNAEGVTLYNLKNIIVFAK